LRQSSQMTPEFEHQQKEDYQQEYCNITLVYDGIASKQRFYIQFSAVMNTTRKCD
ncbi:hypothetical protein L218DRAFT_963960, partial [Marasmius fiardii PR-910]